MEIVVNRNSKGPTAVVSDDLAIINLDLIPKGKFRTLLRKSLGDEDSATLFLEVPDTISLEWHYDYLKGLGNYVNSCRQIIPDVGVASEFDIFLGVLVDVKGMSEDDIFALAVVAREYEDVSPLLRLLQRVEQLDDRYYWLYLAENAELFFHTVEVEIYRRRIVTELHLFPLSENNDLVHQSIDPKQLVQLTKPNVSFRKTFQRLKTVYTKELQQNPRAKWGELPFKKDEGNFVDKILDLGFVIAGAFVDCCINRNYYYREMSPAEFRRILEYFEYSDESGISDSDESEISESSTAANFKSDFDKDIAIFVGMIALHKNFASRGMHFDYSRLKFLEDMRQDYDFEEAEKRFENVISYHGGKIYVKELQIPEVIDIYSTPESESPALLLEYLTAFPHTKITPEISSLKIKLHYSPYTFRLIKMHYASVEDVVASLDLDCERVALYLDDGELQFVAPNSYIYAATYNICLLNPCNDSASYFKRLALCSIQNYSICVTPNIKAFQPSMSLNDEKRFSQVEFIPPEFSELRTVDFTDGAFDVKTNRYVTQYYLNGLTEMLCDQLELVEPFTPKDTILLPLWKQFASNIWFDVEADVRIPSIYVEYRRPNFLFVTVQFLIHRKIKELKDDTWLEERDVIDKLEYVAREREFLSNSEKKSERSQRDQDAAKLFNLVKEKLPSVLAKIALRLTGNDIIDLVNMAETALARVNNFLEYGSPLPEEGIFG